MDRPEMKTWYHLSTESDLEAIVCSDVPRTPRLISPRLPDNCHGESQEIERVCVAPTVWQCLYAIPKSGMLFVYEIRTASNSEPIEDIADSHVTNEVWITNDDVERAGGRISMTNIGIVDRTDQLALSLKIQSLKGKLPKERAEELQIWRINDGQLYLRDEWMI